MTDKDILKMLFEEHHRQYAARWQAMFSTANRAVAVLVALSTWILLRGEAINSDIAPIIIFFIVSFSFLTCGLLISSIGNVTSITGVIVRINTALKLYESGSYIQDEPIYPESWKNFGGTHKRGALLNCLFVVLAAALSIAAVWYRAWQI